MEKDKLDKKKILEELLFTEEDSIKTLQELVEKLKDLIRIDAKSARIVFNVIPKTHEKILLALIGRYYMKELGLSNSKLIKRNELEEITAIKKDSMGVPLTGLQQMDLIINTDKGYMVQHYRIGEIVNALHEKYINNNQGAGIKLNYSPKAKKKREK